MVGGVFVGGGVVGGDVPPEPLETVIENVGSDAVVVPSLTLKVMPE